MEWLKKLLEDNGVPEDIQEEILKGAKDQQQNFIPKSRLDDLSTQNKELKDQLKERDKQLAENIEKAKDNEALKTQLKEQQELNAKIKQESEARINDMRMDTALRSALKASKVKAQYEDLLIGQIDRTKIKLKDDGTLEGLEDIINSQKETYKDLFEVALSGTTPQNNGGSAGGGNPLQADYDAAMKAGDLARAILIKNKMFEPAQPEK